MVAVYVDVDLTTGVPPSHTDGEKLAGMVASRMSPYSPNGGDQRLATLDVPSGPILSRVRCIASLCPFLRSVFADFDNYEHGAK